MKDILSRYTDDSPIKCEDCGWTGKVKDCVHSYRAIPLTEGDVEGVDKCPSCGSDNLIPIEEDLVPA